MIAYLSGGLTVVIGLYVLALGLGAALPPQQHRGRRLLAVLGALMILGGIAAAISDREALSRDRAAETAAEVAAGIRARIDAFPAAIDELTRLEDVRAEADALVFVYTLLLEDRVRAVETVAALRDQMTMTACDEPEMRRYFQAGLSVSYRYTILSGEEIGPITLPPEFCEIYGE